MCIRDSYDIMPGINDESDLGYYYAHEAGIADKVGILFFQRPAPVSYTHLGHPVRKPRN